MSTFERLSNNQVKLTIEVSKEEFNHAIEAVYPKVSKEVKVDGFRPGKVPMNIFLRRFGYEPLYEEALNHAINETYPKAVDEHNVNVVDYPKIDLDFSTVSHETGFTYTATVYVIPEFDLVQYTGLTFDTLSKRVTKKEVEGHVKQRLQQKAENVLKEGAAELGDTCVIDFEGFIDGVAFEGGKAENHELTLGSGQFIPGFEDQLIGAVAEQELDVNVTFPKDYHADLAGKPALFKVVVHEVKTKVVPELTQEFVDEAEIEGVKTVEEFVKHVENEVKDAKAKAYEEDFMQKLLEQLVKVNPIDLPEVMIENQANQIMDNAHRQAEQYKIPFEMFLQFQGLTEETFKQRARENAENQIKVDLILEAIMKKENFVVSEKEIDEEIVKIAEANKMEVEKAKKAINTQEVQYYVQKQKTVDFLKKNNGAKKAEKVEKAEEPKTEEPKAEEPKTEESKAEEKPAKVKKAAKAEEKPAKAKKAAKAEEKPAKVKKEKTEKPAKVKKEKAEKPAKAKKEKVEKTKKAKAE